MKKPLVWCLCLFSSGVWAREATVAPAEAPAEKRPVAFWVQPLVLPLIPFLPYVVPSIQRFIVVPLGLTVPLAPRQDLVFELTPFYESEWGESRNTTKALTVSVGSAWRPFPESKGGGWFVQPKLLGVVANVRHDPFGFEERWEKTSAQASLGLDVGYRMNDERLFLEFVLGASVGYGWNVPRTRQSVLTAITFPTDTDRVNKVVWDYNLNLIRLGIQL
jgi:hypothetical protein